MNLYLLLLSFITAFSCAPVETVTPITEISETEMKSMYKIIVKNQDYDLMDVMLHYNITIEDLYSQYLDHTLIKGLIRIVKFNGILRDVLQILKDNLSRTDYLYYLNYQTQQSDAATFVAIDFNNPEALQILKEQGADFSKKNERGESLAFKSIVLKRKEPERHAMIDIIQPPEETVFRAEQMVFVNSTGKVGYIDQMFYDVHSIVGLDMETMELFNEIADRNNLAPVALHDEEDDRDIEPSTEELATITEYILEFFEQDQPDVTMIKAIGWSIYYKYGSKYLLYLLREGFEENEDDEGELNLAETVGQYWEEEGLVPE